MNKFFMRKEADIFANAIRQGRKALSLPANTKITSDPRLAQYVYDVFMKPRGGNPVNSLLQRWQRAINGSLARVSEGAAYALTSRIRGNQYLRSVDENLYRNAMNNWYAARNMINDGIGKLKTVIPQGWSNAVSKNPANAAVKLLQEGASTAKSAKDEFKSLINK